MDIFINNDKIDFEITGEETCSEIKKELRTWLLEKKHVILRYSINGEEYNENKHDSLNIKEIEKIEIQSEHIEVLTLNSLAEIKNYTERVENNIVKTLNDGLDKFKTENGQGLLKQLIEGFDWCSKAAYNVIKILNIKPSDYTVNDKNNSLQNYLDDFEKGNKNMNEMLNITDKVKLFKYVENEILKHNLVLQKIVVVLFKYLQENKSLLSLDELREGINNNIDVINELKEKLIQIAELLQTGKEPDAMVILSNEFTNLEKITNFFNKIQSSIGVEFKVLSIRDKSFQQCLDEYLEFMKELLESFENKDYVMLSDLLEYELTEFLDIFEETFNRITEYIDELESNIQQEK